MNLQSHEYFNTKKGSERSRSLTPNITKYQTPNIKEIAALALAMTVFIPKAVR